MTAQEMTSAPPKFRAMRRALVMVMLLLGIVGSPSPGHAVGTCEDTGVCAPRADGACVAIGASRTVAGEREDLGRKDATVSETSTLSADPPVHWREVTTPGPFVVHIGAIESRCAGSLKGPDLRDRSMCGETKLNDVVVSFRGTGLPRDVVFSAESLFVTACATVSASGPGPGIAHSRVAAYTEEGRRQELSWVSPTHLPLDPETYVEVNASQRETDGSCGVGTAAGIRIVTPHASLLLGWVSVVACPN